MRTIKRAFLILQTLADQGGRTSLTGLCKKTRLDKATCLRFLNSLEDIDMISKDGVAQYEIGPKVVHFNNAFLKICRVEEKVKPVLEHLVGKTEETALYSMRSEDSRVSLYLVESPHQTRTLVDVGIPVPLASGCVSRAILSFLPEKEIEGILKRREKDLRLTAWSITGRRLIFEKILQTRAKGYATGIKERAPNTNAVAAPVFNNDGVIGSIAIVGPTERLTRRACERWGPLVKLSAQKLSQGLGSQSPLRSRSRTERF